MTTTPGTPEENPQEPPLFEDGYYDDDDRDYGDDTCPNCGETYDDIDREYQICHICKFNNNKP